jgi:hypothetical protein
VTRTARRERVRLRGRVCECEQAQQSKCLNQ